MATETAVLLLPDPARPGAGQKLPRRLTTYLGVVPFTVITALFLLIPTVIVVVGAFAGDDGFTWENLAILGDSSVQTAFANTIGLAVVSSIIGAGVGGVFAYAVSTAPAGGMLRRVVTSGCGVLALFGGVSLAFAFIATFGNAGQVTLWLGDWGVTSVDGGLWLYSLGGLVLVYSYFQIPLMVLIFLPSLDGLKPQWREAAENLGCSTWGYWRWVGIPLLWPPFLASAILLFANAFSAYATVAALITQGSIVIPLKISNALSSEVGVGTAHTANALALAMIVVVVIVTALSALLQRRMAKWTR